VPADAEYSPCSIIIIIIIIIISSSSSMEREWIDQASHQGKVRASRR
jgi:hypothetical protein